MKEKNQRQKHFKDPGTGTPNTSSSHSCYPWPGAVALVSSGGPQPPQSPQHGPQQRKLKENVCERVRGNSTEGVGGGWRKQVSEKRRDK